MSDKPNSTELAFSVAAARRHTRIGANNRYEKVIAQLADLALDLLNALDQARGKTMAVEPGGTWIPLAGERDLRECVASAESIPGKMRHPSKPAVMFDRPAFEKASATVQAANLPSTVPLADLVRADVTLRTLLLGIEHNENIRRPQEGANMRDDLLYWIDEARMRLDEATRAPESGRYAHTDDERRVRYAISTMPGGGAYTKLDTAGHLVGFDSPGAAGRPVPITPGAVADYLEVLRDIRLQEIESHTEDARALASLQQQQEAIRAFLGIKDDE